MCIGAWSVSWLVLLVGTLARPDGSGWRSVAPLVLTSLLFMAYHQDPIHVLENSVRPAPRRALHRDDAGRPRVRARERRGLPRRPNATGKNNCVLHYLQNDKVCRKDQLLLMDVASSYANYNADLTRTIPVSGKFSRRQKRVYNAVLCVLRARDDGPLSQRGQTVAFPARGAAGGRAAGAARQARGGRQREANC